MQRPEQRLRPAHAPDGKQHAGVGLARCALRRRARGRCRRRRSRRASGASGRRRTPPASPAAPARSTSPPRRRTHVVRAHRLRPSPLRRRIRLRRTRTSVSRIAARWCARASSRSAPRSPARARVAMGVSLIGRSGRCCQRRRATIVPTRAAAKRSRSHQACSRRTRACGHPATGSGEAAFAPASSRRAVWREPRSTTKMRNPSPSRSDEKSRRPSGSHAGDTLRLPAMRPPCERCGRSTDRRARSPNAPRATRVRQRWSGRRATSAAQRNATPGSERAGRAVRARGRAAGSDSVASSRRSSRWIVQTITRPSGDTSGSPARAPCGQPLWPAAGIVDHVEIGLQPDLVLDLHLIEDERRAGEPDARAEVAVRHLARGSPRLAREPGAPESHAG